MDPFLAAAALMGVGAITPGPNNLVVLRAAAHAGIRGALPAIVGVVLGSLALLSLVVLGAGALLAAAPRARFAITAAGCAYLVALGAGLVVRSFDAARAHVDREPRVPARMATLFGFQLLNPKGWVMTLTAVTAVGSEPIRAFPLLVVIFTLVPFVCLLVWSSIGALLAGALQRRSVRAWFDRAMGGLLVASALLLLVEGWRIPSGGAR